MSLSVGTTLPPSSCKRSRCLHRHSEDSEALVAKTLLQESVKHNALLIIAMKLDVFDMCTIADHSFLLTRVNPCVAIKHMREQARK